jgi:hypothetical protein
MTPFFSSLCSCSEINITLWRMGEWRYGCTHFNFGTGDAWSASRLCFSRWKSTRAGLDALRRDKLCPCRESNPVYGARTMRTITAGVASVSGGLWWLSVWFVISCNARWDRVLSDSSVWECYRAARLLMHQGIYVCGALLCIAFSVLMASIVNSGNEAGAWQRFLVTAGSQTAWQNAHRSVHETSVRPSGPSTFQPVHKVRCLACWHLVVRRWTAL